MSLVTSTSTTPPEVKVNKKVTDTYPAYAILRCCVIKKDVIDNNHVTVVDMIMTRFDKLERKRIDYIHLSVQEHAKQPQYNISYNYCENLGLYVATNVQIGLFTI